MSSCKRSTPKGAFGSVKFSLSSCVGWRELGGLGCWGWSPAATGMSCCYLVRCIGSKWVISIYFIPLSVG